MSRDFRIVPFALFRPLWCQLLHGQPEGGFLMCVIEGCGRNVVARGWCRKHYNRWYKHGNPNITLNPIVQGSVEDRFWAKVEKTDTCWLWTGGKTPSGYGKFRGESRLVETHRFAYEHIRGPIPEGLVLDHLCRVRHCVNPAHLDPVTHKVNILRGVSPGAIAVRTNVCKRGHWYSAENTGFRETGRRCRTCDRERVSEWREKRRAAR